MKHSSQMIFQKPSQTFDIEVFLSVAFANVVVPVDKISRRSDRFFHSRFGAPSSNDWMSGRDRWEYLLAERPRHPACITLTEVLLSVSRRFNACLVDVNGHKDLLTRFGVT